MYWQSEKNLLNSNTSFTHSHNMLILERWPSNGWDWLVSLRHLSKFQRVSGLGFVIAPTLLSEGQSNFARCLAVYWAGTVYIHFRGCCPPDGILPRAKFTFRPCLEFSYIDNVTAQHWSSGHQPNFAAFRRGRHLYLAGQPSCWTSAHILVEFWLCVEWRYINTFLLEK